MKKSHWLILGLPWVPFIIFWLKPYMVYHGINTVIPVSEFVPDTLQLEWSNSADIKLDSIKSSYKGKRYMFPKPPYTKVKVVGLEDSCKLRYKGDYLRHLKNKVWSFRLKNKKAQKWKGSKKLNFHHPGERLDINEYAFQKHMKAKGHLALDYDFTLVVKNKTDTQLYAYEECIDRDYLNKRNLKGEILRFDEAPLFNWMMYHVPDSYPETLMNKFYMASDILKVGKVQDSIVLKEAIQKLSKWRRGELKTSQVFDVEKTADFFALVDVWGALHSIGYNNIKMFYDQEKRKFELIATDGNSMLLDRLLINQKYQLFITFFKDELFRTKYLKCLDKYKDGRSVSAFLILNYVSIKSRADLIERYYPKADNNLAYLHYNFSKAQE